MHNRHEQAAEWETTLRSAVDDVAESVRLVIDVVIGHGANLLAHVLERVDQLVDDVVADAADVAREAEALFGAARRHEDEDEDASQDGAIPPT